MTWVHLFSMTFYTHSEIAKKENKNKFVREKIIDIETEQRFRDRDTDRDRYREPETSTNIVK